MKSEKRGHRPRFYSAVRYSTKGFESALFRFVSWEDKAGLVKGCGIKWRCDTGGGKAEGGYPSLRNVTETLVEVTL
jgi:hypothetical protein